MTFGKSFDPYIPPGNTDKEPSLSPALHSLDCSPSGRRMRCGLVRGCSTSSWTCREKDAGLVARDAHTSFFFFFFFKWAFSGQECTVLGLPCAGGVAGRRGQLQSGLSLLHLLLLYPSPPFPGVSYRSLFLPLRTVSGSRSTSLGPQAEAQGWDITVREALWVKLNPNSLFGAGGFACISNRVPGMWALLKAASGEQ